MAIKFSHFVSLCSEAYDADLKGATIRRQRDTEARRKTPAEIKRTKTAVDPKTGERKQVPVVQKQRKDAGQARPQSTTSARQQQPTQERGSAQVKQSYAEKEKERRRAAAKARAAAKSGGAKPQSSTSSSKDLSKQADKLLAKKKEEPQKQTTRKNVKRTSASDNLTSAEKQKVGYQARRKETSDKKKQILANLIADYTETHGKPPKGKERTKLVGKANQAATIK